MGLPIWGAKAQPTPYPSKTVKLVIPYPPGGSTDFMGRLLAQKLTEAWKQPVIVDDRPGAGSVTALEQIVKSPADGHTLLFSAAFVSRK